jgi:hypothetical protein
VSLTAPERETIITLNDEDDLARVYTAQRPWITKLKKNPAATLIEEGNFEGSAWAEFEVPKALLSIRSKRVKRDLTQEQRAALGDRLRRASTSSKTPQASGASEQEAPSRGVAA